MPHDGREHSVGSDLSTAQHWDRQADDWNTWAREPGHDSYWTFHGRAFHSLVPEPSGQGLALDLACGEGRVGRDLEVAGWKVVASDYSARLCAHARASGLEMSVAASAADVPFRDGSFDLITVFMGFRDFDQEVLDSAFAECARLLRPGGQLVVAINHPVHSFLHVERLDDSLNFTVKHSYFGEFPYENSISRDGISLTFRGVQRSIARYLGGFMGAGFEMKQLLEVTVPDPETTNHQGSADWANIPMFLDLLLRKP